MSTVNVLSASAKSFIPQRQKTAQRNISPVIVDVEAYKREKTNLLLNRIVAKTSPTDPLLILNLIVNGKTNFKIHRYPNDDVWLETISDLLLNLLKIRLGYALIIFLISKQKPIVIQTGKDTLLETRANKFILQLNVKGMTKVFHYVMDRKNQLRIFPGRAITSLAHELCHVYNWTTGTANINTFIPDLPVWHNREERYAITGIAEGMDFNPFNENAFRRALGLPRRTFHMSADQMLKNDPIFLSMEEWIQQLTQQLT